MLSVRILRVDGSLRKDDPRLPRVGRGDLAEILPALGRLTRCISRIPSAGSRGWGDPGAPLVGHPLFPVGINRRADWAMVGINLSGQCFAHFGIRIDHCRSLPLVYNVGEYRPPTQFG